MQKAAMSRRAMALVTASAMAFGPASLLAEPVKPATGDDWSTDVIGIELMHLNANFWIDRLAEPDQTILDAAAIRSLNAQSFADDPNLVDLSQYPESLSGEALRDAIIALSRPAEGPLFYFQGSQLDADDYARYTQQLNLERIEPVVNVQWALVLKRAAMRTWPTEDRVYSTEDTRDLDRFQENGLFPADVVAVLHHSKDGRWHFVQSYNYAAWVPADVLALGKREDILTYEASDPFLVITGDKVTSNFTPGFPSISELQLDMGVRLPLVPVEQLHDNIHGQNPYTSYTVRLPVRGADGQLAFQPALIARRHDANPGYLPYTPRNVLRQSFKFLGERYGWGHSYNARDCTGLVSEIFKTFGLLLPRNSGQQGASSIGQNLRFTEQDSNATRIKALQQMEIGDLIYSPGHVMIYIGEYSNEPYVLHDTSSELIYRKEDGSLYKGILNGVSVTPLLQLQVSDEASYVDRMYNIKKIR